MINKENLLVFIGFFLIGLFVMWQFIASPAFNLIDDGQSLKVAREVLSGDLGSLIEEENGRFRIAYWLYFVVIYLFSGLNPLGYWISQLVIFSLLLFLIWKISNYETKNNNSSFKLFSFLIVSLLFYVPAVSENLFRLGTAEIRQSLFMFSFIYFVLKKKRQIWSNKDLMTAFLLFTAAQLTKETSIILFPILLIIDLPNFFTSERKQDLIENRIRVYTLLGLNTVILYGFVKGFSDTGAYSSSFKINFSDIKYRILVARINYSEIFYTFVLLISSTAYRYLRSIKKYLVQDTASFISKNPIIMTSIFGFIISLFFVFGWAFDLERYYITSYFFLVIYIVSELKDVLNLVRKNNKSKIIFSYVLVGMSILIISYLKLFQKIPPKIISYVGRSINIQRIWYCDYQSSYKLISYLKNSGKSSYYVDNLDTERVYQIGIFNQIFNGKTEIYSPIADLSMKSDIFIISKPDDHQVVIANDSIVSSYDYGKYEKIFQSSIDESSCDDRLIWVIRSKS